VGGGGVTITYVSPKRPGRIYVRAFDHDEAIALHAEDPICWTPGKLAERYGVSRSGVDRVLHPKRNAQMEAQTQQWTEKNRRPLCKGGCGRRVWMVSKGRSGYCISCLGLIRAKTVRPDTLLCGRCGEWKPDSEFHTQARAKARRQRAGQCKPCATVARRENRHANREREARYANQRYLAKRERKTPVEYIVFQPNGKGFVEVARVEAGSTEHAIEKAATGPGEYVAVTESRFKVMTVAPIESLRVVKEPTA
jgi:hypothetical protein